MTTTYNASFVKTYNMAYGGATVDSALVAPYEPTVLSVKDQVQKEFLPRYGSHPKDVHWDAKDSLFAFFIGINDVGNSWYLGNATLYDAIFARYSSLLDQVHQAGARNFLFLSVPPVQLAPLTLSKNDNGYSVATEGKVIVDWNKRLTAMTAAFKKNHKDVSTFVFDTYSVFDAVIKNPKVYPQTAGYKNTTGYCTAYEK